MTEMKFTPSKGPSGPHSTLLHLTLRNEAEFLKRKQTLLEEYKKEIEEQIKDVKDALKRIADATKEAGQESVKDPAANFRDLVAERENAKKGNVG